MTVLMGEEAKALNRMADALFKCATELKRQTRLHERSVTVSETMCSVTLQNSKVTAQLEEAMKRQLEAHYEYDDDDALSSN